MRSSRGDDRPTTAEADHNPLLRMRLTAPDAAFVAEGIALGLPLKWIERAPLSDDRPPLGLAWRAPEDGVGMSADR